MATFALIHGAGDVGWYWHLVEAELRRHGHDTVAPDLPNDDDAATLVDYADVVVDGIGDRPDVVVVGQSYGGFTAAIVAERVGALALVFVAGMVPAPGESPGEWWAATGYPSSGDGADDDPLEVFYHDVPRALAEEAMSRERGESAAAYADPWPLDALPDVPTRYVLCTEDRVFPAPFVRRMVGDRLGVTPDEIRSGHCVALSRPRDLADLLAGVAEAELRSSRAAAGTSSARRGSRDGVGRAAPGSSSPP